MTADLTARDARLLAALVATTDPATGTPPSQRALARALGCAGHPGRVQDALWRLRAKGVVTWQDGAVRTVRLVTPYVVHRDGRVEPVCAVTLARLAGVA